MDHVDSLGRNGWSAGTLGNYNMIDRDGNIGLTTIIFGALSQFAIPGLVVLAQLSVTTNASSNVDHATVNSIATFPLTADIGTNIAACLVGAAVDAAGCRVARTVAAIDKHSEEKMKT